MRDGPQSNYWGVANVLLIKKWLFELLLIDAMWYVL